MLQTNERRKNVDLSLFSELRGQISSDRVVGGLEGAFISPGYYLPFVSDSAILPPRSLYELRMNIHKILFIYPTELAVMLESERRPLPFAILTIYDKYERLD